jgi:transposase
MLSVEEIYRTYHHGLRAIIDLFERHLRQAYLHPPPPPSLLEKTIQGQMLEIEPLQHQVDRLQDELSQQRYHCFQLRRRVAELEERTQEPVKDSHNSHLPPSADSSQRKRIRNLRQPSGRRVGGQPGHAGTTRKLCPEPDQVINYSPQECKHCNSSLDDSRVASFERRQVIELPAVNMEVIEPRAEVRRCKTCGRKTKGKFPVQAKASVQFGARLRAAAAYLSQYQLLPYERACELIGDWFGVRLSVATLRRSISDCSKKLIKTEARIKKTIRGAEVVHVDETVLSIAGKTKYVHAASAGKLTHYGYEGGRGRAAIEAIGIVPDYGGVIVRDAYPAYDAYQQCKHSLCNVRLLRDLTYVIEGSPTHKRWAEPMKE